KNTIIPLTGITAISLPFLGVLSAGASGSFGSLTNNGTDKYQGTYQQFSNINFQNAWQHASDTDFGFNAATNHDDVNNYEYSQLQTERRLAMEGVTFNPSEIKTPYLENKVLIEEIIDKENNNYSYAVSKSNKRKWRITFNNFFSPRQSDIKNTKEENKNQDADKANWFAPNTYNDNRMGIILTKDLKIVDNTFRATLLFRDKLYKEVGLNASQTHIRGRTYKFINNGNQFYAYNGNKITRPKVRGNFNVNLINSKDYNSNVLLQEEVKLNRSFTQDWDYKDWNNRNSGLDRIAFQDQISLGNFRYFTLIKKERENYHSTLQKINKIWYTHNDTTFSNGAVTYGQSVESLFTGLAAPNSNNTPFKKVLDNVGSILYFQSGNIYSRWRDNSLKVPAVVVEFETERNHDLVNGKYPYLENTTSGISAAYAVGGTARYTYSSKSQYGPYTTVQTLSWNRGNKKAVKVKVNANAEVVLGNRSTNHYLPPFGYQLKYKDKVIATIPESEIKKAIPKYDGTKKQLTIEYTFNTDISKWGSGISNYGQLTDKNNLKLEAIYPSGAKEFFERNTGYLPTSTRQPNANAAVDIVTGAWQEDTNSWKYNNEIRFKSRLQWGRGKGGKKLNLLKIIRNTHTSSDNTRFVRQTLLPEQQNRLEKAVYDDWTHKNFDSDLWGKQLNDLLEMDYKAKQLDESVKRYNDIVAHPDNQLGFMNSSNWDNVTHQDRNKILATVNYAFAQENAKETFKQKKGRISGWEANAIPNYNTPGSTADANNVVANTNALITEVKQSEDALKTAWKLDNSVLNIATTPEDYVRLMFEKVDSLNELSADFKRSAKDMIIKQGNRQGANDYAKKLIELNNALVSIKSDLNAYKQVKDNAKFDSLKSGTQWEDFKNKVTETETFVNQFTASSSTDASLNNINTQLGKVNAFTNVLPDKYKALKADIEKAKNDINALSKLKPEESTRLKGDIDGIYSSATPNYKELNNFDQREFKIKKTLTNASFLNHLNSTNDIVNQNFPVYSPTKTTQTFNYANELKNAFDVEYNKISSNSNNQLSDLETLWKNKATVGAQWINEVYSQPKYNVLNKAQKAYVIKQITDWTKTASNPTAKNDSTYNSIKNNLDSLVSKMTTLGTELNKYNSQATDGSIFKKPIYTDSGSDAKNNFDREYDEAAKVLQKNTNASYEKNNTSQPNNSNYEVKYLSPADLDTLKTKLTTARDNLNGSKNVLINRIKALKQAVNDDAVLSDTEVNEFINKQQQSGFLSDANYNEANQEQNFTEAYNKLVKEKVDSLLTSANNLHQQDKDAIKHLVDSAKATNANPNLATVVAKAKKAIADSNEVVEHINNSPNFDGITSAQKTRLIEEFKKQPRFLTNNTFVDNVATNFENNTVKPVADSTNELKQLVQRIKDSNTLGTDKHNSSRNKTQFDNAYSQAHPDNFDTFGNIDPSSINNIKDTLNREFNALNGLKQKLQQKIDQIDPKLKTYLTEGVYNPAVDITNLEINNDTQYDTGYKTVLNNLKQKLVEKIKGLDNLNTSQKQALETEINDINVDEFNKLVPFIEKTNELNNVMTTLKQQIKVANDFKAEKAEVLKLLTPDQKQTFDQVLAKAKEIAPDNNSNGTNANKQAVEKAIKDLQDALGQIQADALKKEIKDKLTEINNDSSNKAQETKTTIDGRVDNATNNQLRKDLTTLNEVLAKEKLQKTFENAKKLTEQSDDLVKTLAEAEKLLTDGLINNSDYTDMEIKLADLTRANTLEKLVKKAKEQALDTNSHLKEEIAKAEKILADKTTSLYPKSIQDLQEALNKKDLENSIKEAEKQGNKDTYPILKNALVKANEVFSNKEASVDTINDANEKLKQAIDKAKKAGNVKALLQDLVNDTESKQAIKDNEITSQHLTTAKAKLADNSANEDALKNEYNKLSVANALSELDNLAKQAEKTQNSSNKLKQAISSAKEYINNNKELVKDNLEENKAIEIQNAVAKEIKKLNNATNKENLANEINKALSIAPNTSDANNKLQEAIKQANALYDNLENQATDDITSAINNLQVNSELLNLDKLIKHAQTVDPKSENLKQAIVKANEKLASTDLNELKQANKDLQAALDRESLNKSIAKAKEVLSKLNDNASQISPELANDINKLNQAKQDIQNAITAAETELSKTP
ncbi:hypothetical protein, partial [Mycoplasma nasistruthionis]|uniref:hypothetical protein n=1 Tax=Mycoplasma nasistruthionis TaxID=353852 RepID=UPI001ABF9157